MKKTLLLLLCLFIFFSSNLKATTEDFAQYEVKKYLLSNGETALLQKRGDYYFEVIENPDGSLTYTTDPFEIYPVVELTEE